MSAMTSRERSDLQQLARMNARVAKADVEALVATRYAEFEHELARDWSAQELQVDELIAEANAKAQEINAKITEECDRLGIRAELRPRFHQLFGQSPRAMRDRESELRRLAKADLDAAGKRAKTEIDRQTAAVCAEIVSTGLSSADAQSFLGRVASPDQLVPALDVAAIEAKAGGR